MDSMGLTNSWIDALSHLRSALYILDQNEAPAHIGAQLDLAISQLEQLTIEGTKSRADSAVQLSGTA